MDVVVYQGATKINDNRTLYHLRVKLGLVSWKLARNSDALCTYEQLMRQNFPAEPFPALGVEGAHDLELVRAFCSAVAHCSTTTVLESSATRSFFGVPNFLSLDPNRSVLSVPLNVLLPNTSLRGVELGVVVCVIALVVGSPAVFFNTPANAQWMVGTCCAVFCWFSVCTDGLLNSMLTQRAVNFTFRHSDSAFLFVLVGVLVGLALNSAHSALAFAGYSAVRGMALFALADVVHRVRKRHGGQQGAATRF